MDATADQFDLDALEIRAARLEDHDAVRALFWAGVEEGLVRSNDTGADIDNLEEGYFSDGGESGFWVGCHRGQIVGMIGVQKTSDNMAEVRRLRVRSTHRRLGVGTRLMRHALEFCTQKSYLKIVLDVQYDRGPAIALFEKSGFKLARTREVSGRRMLDFYLDLYREPEG